MHHSQSEHYASQAEIAARAGQSSAAVDYYRLAATEEANALADLDSGKTRTLGITVISAAALWMKAEEYAQAERLALEWLGNKQLPEFAKIELRTILQSIWSEQQFQRMGISLSKRDVLVSLSGGEVVIGAAPLDLIHQKENEVCNIFFRVIEMLLGKPSRRRGGPSAEIQNQFRPWLLQASPGSYQFAVRIQQSPQMALFSGDELTTEEITAKFLEVVEATVQDPEGVLTEVVPDNDYRKAFLRLSRNLAPTGKTYKRLEMRPGDDRQASAIVMLPESRSEIDQSLQRATQATQTVAGVNRERIAGVLRAVHLDKDWIELHNNEQTVRIERAGDMIDDIVGPMVNHSVIVDVTVTSGKRYFQDIQLDE